MAKEWILSRALTEISMFSPNAKILSCLSKSENPRVIARPKRQALKIFGTAGVSIRRQADLAGDGHDHRSQRYKARC